jgi:hypothetical protein
MKISNLPPAVELTNDDFFVIVNHESEGKQTQKLTAAQLLDYMQAGTNNSSIFVYSNLSNFPTSGTTNSIYIDQEEKGIYIWDNINYLLLNDGSNISSSGTITSGTWNAETIAVLYGGTGATDAATARTNLGVAIGTNVQAYSSNLEAISAGTYAGSTGINTVGTIATGTWNAGTVAIEHGGTGATNAAAARVNLEIGTISTQNSNNVNITGGFLSGVNISGYATLNSNNSTIGNITISDNTISSTSGDVLLKSYSGKISLGNVSNTNANKNIYLLRAYTNDNTQTSLTLDGDVPNQNNILKIKSNKAIWNYDIKISAYNETANEASIFNIRGAVQKTPLGASVIPENIQEEWKSSSMENCSVFVDTNNLGSDFYLEVKVVGVESTNIQWSAIVDVCELIVPTVNFSNVVKINT